jgi:hypothetical protein
VLFFECTVYGVVIRDDGVIDVIGVEAVDPAVVRAGRAQERTEFALFLVDKADVGAAQCGPFDGRGGDPLFVVARVKALDSTEDVGHTSRLSKETR